MRRILFLTSQFPYPAVRGGTLVSSRLLEFLTETYDITMAALQKGGDADTELPPGLHLKEWKTWPVSAPRSAKSLIFSYLHGVPLNVYRSRNPELIAWVKEYAETFDLILADHFEMFQYIPRDCLVPVVLHEHNAEYRMWERFAELQESPLRKGMLQLEAWRVRHTEAAWCRRADAVLAFPNDREALIRISPDAHLFEILPSGDDALLQLPDIQWEDTEKALLYIGTLNWEANIDGLCWFLREVWPEIVAQHPDATFYIIGSEADKRITDAVEQSQGVQLTGFVADLGPWYQRCRVFVAPLRFGSGVKMKVLNALLRGLPVLTTHIGAEGLPVLGGKDLIITDSPKEMSTEAIRLLTDSTHWQSLRDASRATARAHLLGRRQLEKVQSVIESLLSDS